MGEYIFIYILIVADVKLYIKSSLDSCFNVKVNYVNKSYTDGYYLKTGN